MSNHVWQDYIDVSLIGSGHIAQAAIISCDGKSIWANSKGFELSANERKVLSDVLKGNDEARDKAYEHGITFNEKKYVLTRVEDRSMYARMNKDGVVASATKQTIIIGTHLGTQIAGNASATVESLADYLIGQGY
ncbi:profilin [Kamptonema sp. UHCC 0994]|uniref:profilin n=1 Tax=Kamptonema sp. UHCC 0994 TaxID=3031329 RepID=UPI0023BA070C|nr:profilin [Kamptonema sp. UHCC 0994]MDF0554750.1 profilin [Kamptonema sp. UHCC 0994]